MSEAATRLRKAVVERVLHGPGEATGEARRAAFDNRSVAQPATLLVDKVAREATQVTDADFAAARAGGLSEDQLFELCVCASVGEATRQLDAALAALALVGDA